MAPSTADQDEKTKPGMGGAAPAGSSAGGGDVENPAPAASADASALRRRWREAGFLEKASLVLRLLAWLFSAIAFLVMACNKHGDWKEFDKYQEYRYLVAISVLAFLYTTAQVVRQTLPLAGWNDVLSPRAAATVDFAGDQVTAYLVMSAMSAAVPITNRMREGGDNIFTDSSSASISMAFLAFAALAVAALVSGLKLSRQGYTS